MLTQKKNPYRKKSRANNSKKSYDGYNKRNHVKFDNNYKNPEREQKQKQFIKKLEEGEELTKNKFDVFSNVNEKYAHDLVVLGAIAQAAIKIDEVVRSKAEQKLLEKIKKEELADKDFQHNMENYLDFKTQFKLTKIIEAKLTTPGLNEKEKNSLQEQLDKTNIKLESVAQKFKFHTNNAEDILQFQTSNDFLKFIDKQEMNSFSNSYRKDILDPDELNKIYNTNSNKLFSLAVETRDNFDSVTVNNLDKKTTQTIEEFDLAEAAKKVTPVAATLG